MSALEPGLYRATVRGVADQIVMVPDWGYSHRNVTLGGVPAQGYAGLHTHADDAITDARPLIVLDLERPSDLVGSLHDAIAMMLRGGPNHHRLSSLLDQIETQTKPARIPEPGWDGKVIAHTVTNPTRREFVRYGGRPSKDRFNWSDGQGFGSTSWDVLIDPTEIRAGVAS